MRLSLLNIKGWYHLRVRTCEHNFTRSLKTRHRQTAEQHLEEIKRQFQGHEGSALRRLDDLTIGRYSMNPKKGLIRLQDDTYDRYQQTLSDFRQWCRSHSISLLLDINAPVIRRYAEFLSSQFSGNTAKNHLTSLSKIWRDNGLKSDLWLDKSNRPQIIEGKREDFSIHEIQTILALYEFSDTEIYGVLLLGAYCGMRLGDAVHLRWENVREGVLSYRTRKTNFLIEYRLPSRVFIYLKSLGKRSGLKDKTGYIFPKCVRSYAKSRSAVSARVNRAISRVICCRVLRVSGRVRGISRFCYHSFRHSFCTRMVERGESFTQIRALTGSSVKLLISRYGDHIKRADCDRAMTESVSDLDALNGIGVGK